MATAFLTKSEVTYWGSSGPGTSRAILFPTNGQLMSLREDLSLEEPFVRNGRRIKSAVETPIELSDVSQVALDVYATAYRELQEAQERFNAVKEAFKTSAGGQELAKILVPEKAKLSVEEVWSEEEVNDIVRFVESQGENDKTKVVTKELGVDGYSVGNMMLRLAEPGPPTDFLKDVKVYKDIYSVKYLGRGYIQIYKNGLWHPTYRSDDLKEMHDAISLMQNCAKTPAQK